MNRNKVIHKPTYNNKFAGLNSDSDEDKNEDKPEILQKQEIKVEMKQEIKENNDNTEKSVEDDFVEKYYKKSMPKRNNNNYNNRRKYDNKTNESRNNENRNSYSKDEFKDVIRKRRERVYYDYDYKHPTENIIEEELLNSFRMLVHHVDDKSWDYNSYHKIYEMRKWGDVAKLFNSMMRSENYNYRDYDLFVMKNDISPMWEDSENRNGSFCSVRIDDMEEAFRVLYKLVIMACNNSLISYSSDTWDMINGLSFSPKQVEINKDGEVSKVLCVIIKVWFKKNYTHNYVIEKFLTKDAFNLLNKYSVKMRAIRPEF